MGEEIRGYVVAFILVPMAIGLAWMGAYRVVTGKWPDVAREMCYTEWEGRANPTACE